MEAEGTASIFAVVGEDNTIPSLERAWRRHHIHTVEAVGAGRENIDEKKQSE